MNSLEIERFLQSDFKCAKHFGDIIASDQLQSLNPELRTLYIVNTAPRNHPGSHWTAIYYEDDVHPIEFWDSLGQAPESYGPYFSEFFKKYKHQYINTRLQGQKSTCGHFCLFYAFYKCRAFTLDSILEMLSFDVTCNDAIVINFVQSRMLA